jgi:uncharacterized protein
MSVSSDVSTRLANGLRTNEALWECLHRFSTLNLPAWYLGAGCVAQTIWNIAHGRAPSADILDYDLVYYDREFSAEREDRVTREARKLVADLHIELDVTNEARVHIWYPERFGYGIQPYQSIEDAIGTWPTTATAIGVRPSGHQLQVYAPFGTDDLFNLVVRPNRVQITQAIYDAKLARWATRWPSLVVLPWEEGVGQPGLRYLDVGVRP